MLSITLTVEGTESFLPISEYARSAAVLLQIFPGYVFFMQSILVTQSTESIYRHVAKAI